MTITTTKKALTDALSTLERVIPTRSSNPALTALHMAARDGTLTLSGTNLELDVQATLSAEVSGTHALTVPAHLFAQIIRNTPGETVTLTPHGGQLTVQAGGSHFNLQTGEPDAFPPLTFPDGPGVTYHADTLRAALTAVRYAASSDAFQAVFRGVKFERHAGRARFVASDGYRVALHDLPAPDQDDAPPLIIPARSADEILKALRPGDVTLTAGDGTLTVSTDRLRMKVRLMDGDFPDYERVIPQDMKLHVIVPAAQLKDAVNRVAVLADKNANNRVEFVVMDGHLRLSAEGDYGRGQDTLSVTHGGTEPAMSLAFNARHVLDALAPIDGDVRLNFSGSTTPAVFEPLAGGGYRAMTVTLKS